MGVFFWGYLFTQFLSGYLSDMLGGERVILISSCLWSFTTVLFIGLPSISFDRSVVFTLFLFFRFLHGAFQGRFVPLFVFT
ncbi:unnamed protein product [Protopolystoma xenopodis]|uniref:Major facilitator superfamily (MFS) profile domain-containing protein n=1 Tax=Protopolystoma xenopodis TaxID=117903 RepID=A0A448X2S7_9PLAT|nr:unnamed protein product [Protopolystoma xenopodis]